MAVSYTHLLKTHPDAPLVIMANSNLVGKWATSENFYDLYDKNLIAWGGLTAGDWQYIGCLLYTSRCV